MAKPDWQIVQEILDRSKGRDTSVTAKEVTKVLGKRIRQRRREDFSQTAARIVREATEGR